MEELLETIVDQNTRILDLLERLANHLGAIEGELQWHKNLSAAAQIIKAVNDVKEAIHAQS